MGGLSLPLEARVLPNGDEVAVRSKAVVLRLNLPGNTMSGPPSSSLAAPSSALTAPSPSLTAQSSSLTGQSSSLTSSTAEALNNNGGSWGSAERGFEREGGVGGRGGGRMSPAGDAEGPMVAVASVER